MLIEEIKPQYIILKPSLCGDIGLPTTISPLRRYGYRLVGYIGS